MDEWFDVGDQVTLFADFKNVAGAAADPTAVVVTVRSPSGVTTTPAVTHPALGRYEANLSIDQHGTWHYRFAGTGALVAVEEGSFVVRRSKVA
jgi:uncharacterized protein YfaS (alpha-2-macroglobulin family)